MHLLTKPGSLRQTVGKGLLLTAPKLMKALTVIGTAAMFLVGGGILAHGVEPLHHFIEHIGDVVGLFGGVVAALLNALVGVAGGALALAVVSVGGKLAAVFKGQKA